MTPPKKWTVRAAGLVLTALTVVGVWAAFNASVIRARYAAQQLRTVGTDPERDQWADALVTYGAPGFGRLVECLKTGNEPARAAAVGALDRHLSALPDGDTRAVTICAAVIEAYPSCGPEGKAGVLRLVPTVLNRTGGAYADRCRAIVAECLKAPEPDVQLTAVKIAIHPEIRLRAEVTPLLASPEPAVRSASLFAVAGSADGEPVLRDEELFKWLHDPDPGVRRVCHDALVNRDRTDVEITLGRRLTHPDATERLKLLLDLRYDHDVADPEQWLDRLSRDPEPAVRAGAARVMVELGRGRKLPVPTWVGRVADADPHPTVRSVVDYYRTLPPDRPEGVAPAGGP
ncbi:hypothetical protein R5W24_003018 [Gemmata sp. JC717]|uniref:HEAT repeat domain-containing protein n=1 Tax=Gemmata algarum TaxID=2975278 RepID=UPI0021BA6174|nr:hypothetical protein [Gemmata algarum]MDY3553904.1 hypothetical protein [Gemmata algarum]